MPAAVSGRRKKMRAYCFPSCFSPSAADDSPEKPPEKTSGRSPDPLFWARVCCQNKTVPLVEEIAAVGEGHVAEGGEIKREVPPPVISPAANWLKGMPEKPRKVEKRCKITGTKPLIHKPSSTCSNKRSNNQHSSINHQRTATLHSVNHHGPVLTRTRTRMIHSGLPDPTRPICSIQAYPRLGLLITLKMVAIMLASILIGGKFFAVFITTICFYFLSYAGPSQSPVLMASARKIIRR